MTTEAMPAVGRTVIRRLLGAMDRPLPATYTEWLERAAEQAERFWWEIGDRFGLTASHVWLILNQSWRHVE